MKDSSEIADCISVLQGNFDPAELFWLYLHLNSSNSKYNTDDFLSKDSTRLKWFCRFYKIAS